MGNPSSSVNASARLEEALAKLSKAKEAGVKLALLPEDCNSKLNPSRFLRAAIPLILALCF